MSRVLVVHHTVSPSLQDLLESSLTGLASAARQLDADITIETRAALIASPLDVLAADAVLLGTPANIGYMSGALKHFFDQIYYPCLAETGGLPYGLYVHGNNDTAGARRAVETITLGLGWQRVGAAVMIEGEVAVTDRERIHNLAGLVAAAIG